MSLPLVSLLTLFPLLAFCTQLRLSTPSIWTPADYTLQLTQPSTTVPLGSTLQLLLTTDFSPDDLNAGLPYSGTQLPDGYCPIDCVTVGVSYGGLVFNVSGMFTEADLPLMLQYTIRGVMNPRYGRVVGGIVIRVIDTAGVVVYSRNAGNVTYVPRAMACTGLAQGFTAVGFGGMALLTITPATNPRDSPLALITYQFPSSWAGEPFTGTTTLTPDPYCISPSLPTSPCTRSGSTFTLATSFASPITLEVHSLSNPSSAMPAGLVTINTLTAGRNKLDTCTINITGFTQNVFRSQSMTITYSSASLMDVLVGFTFPTQIAAGTQVVVTFPAGLSMAGASFQALLAGNPLPAVSPQYIPGNNSVVFSPFTSLIFKPAIQLLCRNVVRPRVAAPTGNLTIESYFNGSYVAAMSCCSVVLQPRMSLAVTSAATDKPYLQTSNATYTFTLGLTRALNPTDMVLFYFPRQYTLSPGSHPCTLTASSQPLTGTPLCTASSSSLLTLTNFLVSPSSASATLTISIGSIQNPTRDPSSTPFSIYTTDTQSQIIQGNSNVLVPIAAASVVALSVSAGSTVVLAGNVTYSVSVTTNGLVVYNYYLKVDLPVEVGVDEGLLTCQVNGKLFPCWFAAQAVTIRCVESLLSTMVVVAIGGLTNPQSKGPTGGFRVEVRDAEGNVLEQGGPVAGPVMGVAGVFRYVWAWAAGAIIGQGTTLRTVLIAPFAYRPTHRLLLHYSPAQLSLPSTCAPLTCSLSGTTLTISNLPPSDTLSLSLPGTTVLLPTPTLTFTLQDSIYDSLSGTATVASVGVGFITYTVTQSNYQLGGVGNLTIAYALSTGISNVAYVLVQIPREYTAAIPNNTLNTTTSTTTLVVPSITNPNSSTSSYFTLTAHSTNHSILAISTLNAKFTPSCDLPCRSCLPGARDHCLTCYLWSIYNILDINTAKCVSHCPMYYYHSITLQSCLPCTNNCTICDSNNGSRCYTCDNSTYLDQNDSLCYSDCPIGMYEDGGSRMCRACQSGCATCLYYNYCYTCVNGLYLYINQCVSACPPVTYTSANNSCLACPTPNCIHCTPLCLACTPGYYLYNNLCYILCPAPLLPTVAGKCQMCHCASCDTLATNCTACNALKPYFYAGYCYGGCPGGMYAGAGGLCLGCPPECRLCAGQGLCTGCREGYVLWLGNGSQGECRVSCPTGTILTLAVDQTPSCLPCTAPCLTCQTATTFCLTCVSPYLLLNNTCTLACPAPLHALSGSCQPCIPSCLSCQPSDPYNCTECQPGHYLASTTCTPICPSGTYTDLPNKLCIPCNSVCRLCANSTNCTACASGFYLFNWFCYAGCPTTPVLYYQFQGTCMACQPQCVACVGSPVECTACAHGDYFWNVVTKECTFECIAGYFRNGSTCVPCQSPCSTCDTTFSSCATCQPGLYLYIGTCVTACPAGYFPNSSSLSCSACTFPCRLCVQTQCLLCQSFAYMYGRECVLQCPADMPYQQPGYCSDCIGIGFCARCLQSQNSDQLICSTCVYPYVLFDGRCLNECPVNYTQAEVAGVRGCKYTDSYALYLQQLQVYNRPLVPPFLFFALAVVIITIASAVSSRMYRYTYHAGHMISILCCLDSIFIYYSMYYVWTRYTGEYIPLAPRLPFVLVTVGMVGNHALLTVVYYLWVLRGVYLRDVRYREWRECYLGYWWGLVVVMPLLGGPRLHKVNYSKWGGLGLFAYRIVSVQKFYQEDVVTYWSVLGDVCQLAGFIFVELNVFLGYSGLLLLGYECLAIKVMLWGLLLYDFKKPDRGFFIGDEQQAEKDMLREREEEERKVKERGMDNLVRLVRTKSEQLLRGPNFDIETKDFMSEYNPEDYEDVIRVPLSKIEKNIYKGKYRKGKKVTIEQKLQKFADSIKPKPKPKPKKVGSYLHNLIYWKPPQKPSRKLQKYVAPSEESLLNLLQQKEIQYKEDLDQIQLVNDEESKRYYARPRYGQSTFLEDLDETIPNQTLEFFYPSNSINTQARKQSVDFDDLMNLNYARKKHLQKSPRVSGAKQESKRVLYHEPQKKRRTNLSGAAQMILKN